MSIKDLFGKYQQPTQILSSDSISNISRDAESERYVEQKIKDKERYIPQLDFKDPANFAKFGLAEEYYEQSFVKIYNTFPYDGSRHEVQEWFNSASFFDKYIFDNEYPRTTGYAIFGDSGDNGAWGTQVENSDGFYSLPSDDSDDVIYGYGAPATSSYEYIYIKGGPHKDPDNTKLKDIFPSNDGKANIYKLNQNRECNLKIGGADGNTVEFWMKKAAFDASNTRREVILDAWSHSSVSSSVSYGRFTVEMDSGPTLGDGSRETSHSPFLITYMSGTQGIATASFDSGSIDTSRIADNKWHHYAFSVRNLNSQLKMKLYIDGEFKNEIVTGSSIGYVSSSLNATIGALITKPSASISPEGPFIAGDDTSLQPNVGWGKLSASLDEFRYWKVEKGAQQIGRNWYRNIYGGTNTDVANTHLGVYYKFNEGITGTSSIDNVVLDYSGRGSNGTWVGYSSNSRNTGSALIQSSASATEFKDPIIRVDHPDVQAKLSSLKQKGKEYDLNNNAAIYNSIPEWIRSEDQESGQNLVKLTQIISHYFDTLAMQIKALPGLKAPTYPSSSYKAIPFADKLLESHGLIVPELFTDSTVLQQFAQQDETRIFDKDLREVKNLIYKNIYNNLSYIYKSKGTEKAFRNLIRCFGIDDEIVKINIYGDNAMYEIKDNYRHTITKKNYADFSTHETNGAVVYQFVDNNNPNSVGFITSSVNSFSGSFRTLEAEVIFPKQIHPKLTNYRYNLTASSLFGFHTAGTEDETTTWTTPDHDLRVLAIREHPNSNDAYFKLESDFLDSFEDGLSFLTSSLFYNVYDDEKWNFAVRIKRGIPRVGDRDLYPLSPGVSGSGLVDAENDNDLSGSIEFYGVNAVQDYIKNEFVVSSSISVQKYRDLIESTKRIYAGAHRENFTGNVIESSDVKVSSVRYWLNDISDSAIRAHAIDVENFGTDHPYRNAYLFQGPDKFNFYATGSRYVPNMETLALHWDFAGITGSDDSGEFIVTDMSSGSADSIRYGFVASGDSIDSPLGVPLSRTLKRQHSGLGKHFPANSSKVVDRIYLSNAKQQPPEIIASSNMVEGRTRDDRLLTRNSRPITHFIGIEKSPYQSVTEEMLKVFATLTDFNNLIGEPVNTYRPNYKQMEKLRQLFFEKVDNIPNVEKYIEYYKWIDNAVDAIIHQLMPASANTSENLSTIIESHVLERNKFRHKYPLLDPITSSLQIDGTLDKVEQENSCIRSPRDDVQLISRFAPGDAMDLYSYTPAHFKQRKFSTLLAAFENRAASPTSDHMNGYGDTSRSTEWWRTRAERDKTDEISSGDSTVDSQRETFRKVINKENKPSGQFELMANTDMGQISGFISFGLWQGSNSQPKSPYTRTVLKPFSPTTRLRVTASDSSAEVPYGFQVLSDIKDELIPGITSGKRLKLNFHVQNVEDETILSSHFIPFNIHTSSAGRKITNIHDDMSLGGEISMQGPFTERYVGGLQYRHIPLNISGTTSELDTDKTRPEGFKIHVTNTPFSYENGSEDEKKVFKNAGNGALINFTSPDINSDLQLDPELPRAMFFREEMAKRPVNIRNIKSSSYNGVGNYSKDYELILTCGRTTNNFYFVDTKGVMSASVVASDFPDLKEFALPERKPNEIVVVNRFSAPGGPEVMSRGFLDTNAEEYSVYNALPWRNLTVRRLYNTLLKNSATKGGVYDSTYVDPLGVYESSASYHKVDPNPLYKLEWSAGIGSPVITGSMKDNGFVVHAIPRSELQYAWITASAYQVSGGLTENEAIPFGWSKPNQKLGGASDDITFLVATDIIINGTPMPFGLNNIYVDDIDIDNNLISPSSDSGRGENSKFPVFSISQAETDPNTGQYPRPDIAMINHNRNGPYGWPTWKQIRTGDHMIARHQRKNNIYSFFKNDNKILKVTNGIPGYQDTKELVNYIIPVVTTKYKPLEKTFQVDDEEINVSYTHGNLKTSFLIGEGDLDKEQFNFQTCYDMDDTLTMAADKNVIKLKDITYREIVFPRAEYTTLAKSNRRLSYDEFRHTGSNGYDRLHGTHRTFWRARAQERLRTNQHATNSLGVGLSSYNHAADGGGITEQVGAGGSYFKGDWVHPLRPLALSVWPLDSFHGGFMSGGFEGHNEGVHKRNVGATGELYAHTDGALVSSSDAGSAGGSPSQCFFFYQHYGWFGSSDSQTWPSDYYILPTGEGKNKPDFTDGAAAGTVHLYHFKPQYSASAISGLAPWYDSYEDYARDVTCIGPDYSILPEFNVSDHMEYYLNSGFLSKNNKYLSLPGAATKTNKDTAIVDLEINVMNDYDFNVAHHISSSAGSEKSAVNDDFYKIYSHSDFLDSFELVRNRNPDNKVSQITLKCKGIKKLLPYQGFYPVLRCVQLGSIFSQSFGPYLTSSLNTNQRRGKQAQALIQPFFAPGIMYNTIKSGIAVDWPVITGSSKAGDLSSFGNLGYLATGSSLADKQYHNRRFPFEALVHPEKYIPVDKQLLRPGQSTVEEAASRINMVVSPSYRSGSQTDDTNVYELEANAPHYIWTGQHDNKYNLAMHNFLGEIPKFFLKGERLTTFASKRGPFTMTSGTTYYMDVVLEKTKDFIMYEGPHTYMQETNPKSGVIRYSSGSARGIHYGPACDTLGAKETVSSTGVVEVTDASSTAADQTIAMNSTSGTTYTLTFHASTTTSTDTTSPTAAYSSTNSTLAANIASALNATSAFTATASGQIVTIIALPGTNTNSISTSSGAAFTLTNFSGGAASLFAHTNNGNYNWLSNMQDPAFAPYTPPYFYGESVARISFSPHIHRELLSSEPTQQFYIDEILEGAKLETVYEPNRSASYGQAINLSKAKDNTGEPINEGDMAGYIRVPDEKSLAGVSKMKIDSSINLFGKARVKELEYKLDSAMEHTYVPVLAKDSTDDSFDIWTISTKFETPTLNFSSNAKSHFTRGMWFGYGTEPSHGNGIFLRLRESFPDKIGKTTSMEQFSANPFANNINLLNVTETSKTGSLLEVCGFVQAGTSTKRRIGEIAESKEISEAIIAIPFKAKTSSTKKRFFEIPKKYIDVARGHASKSVVDKLKKTGVIVSPAVFQMVENMQKYVIPPHHDFVTNKSVKPFAMYVFEFKHLLDREDLSNIWQNLMPKIARSSEVEEVSITHECGVPGGFFENDIPPDIKWMVYKVKKKAESNYFNVTSDSQDDNRFQFNFNIDSENPNPDYSYNWPYDFCSLVELAKLEVGINLSDKEVDLVHGPKPIVGTTSKDTGHTHAFTIDVNGNGVAHEACYPVDVAPGVCHEHKIISWEVQASGSELTPLHTHKVR